MGPWFIVTTTSTKGASEPVLLTSFRGSSQQPLKPKAGLCFSVISWYTPYPHSAMVSGPGVLLRWQGAVSELAHLHRPSSQCASPGVAEHRAFMELICKDWTCMPECVQDGLG